MGRVPPVPPEEPGEDDQFDEDDSGFIEEETYERLHKPGKSDRLPRKFRREEGWPGPRPKRDHRHGRPAKGEPPDDKD